MSDADLSTTLSDGSCLIESPGPLSDLKSVLLARLAKYYARLGLANIADTASLELIQFTTAKEALSVVSRAQKIVGIDIRSENGLPPLIGTRDLAQLRTLLSIVFKWGIDPLFTRIVPALLNAASGRNAHESAQVNLPEDYASLSTLVTDLFSLLFPDGVQGRIPQTLITSTILERHPVELLKSSMALGWLPRSLNLKSCPTLDTTRPLALRFLAILPPYEAIHVLGKILSSHPTLPPYGRKLCVTLLGRQLLRPQGIQSLCAAVFGEDEAALDSLEEKLQHFAKVLTTVPNIDPEEHFRRIIPRLIDLLSPLESVVNKRAAAYVVSRLLSADGPFPHQAIASKIALSALHDPFFRASKSTPHLDLLTSDNPAHLAPSLTLDTLLTFVSNADPSPTLISNLLSPIVSILYSLLYHMDKVKTADPDLRESLRGLLITWAKIVESAEGVNILWSILHSDYYQWTIASVGTFRRVEVPDQQRPLSFLTPQDLNVEDVSLSLESNILNLYPDPVHFVEFLKTIKRTDVSSELFVNLLEAYRNHKSTVDEDPTRTLLYLQVITLMQTQLTDGKSSTNILYKSTHMLSFIKHVLEPAERPTKRIREDQNSLLLADRNDSPLEECDSDDENLSGAELTAVDSEMIETAITLLLSILEANEDLSVVNTPVLNDVFPLLEPLAQGKSGTLRSLAREARMVMTARLASTSAKHMNAGHNQIKESAYDIYQKALKHLQDPILPVRAHGLLLLRQLVLPAPDSDRPQLNDDALVPAILSIFLQSVQDDDSYVFLNAVQGLAAMVEKFGKDVLSHLLAEYTRGLDGLGMANLTQHDLDIRLRIGEALSVVIKRCGEALSIHVDTIVPPLLKISRLSYIPTALRASSLSLLAGCESASPLSMLLYVQDLAEAMIDILQVESVPAKPISSVAQAEEDSQQLNTSSQPLSTDAKLPTLRRAALHFLSLLFSGITKQIYDASYGGSLLSDPFLRRAKTTLSYIAATDGDIMVKIMAKETNEHLNQMNKAAIGL